MKQRCYVKNTDVRREKMNVSRETQSIIATRVKKLRGKGNVSRETDICRSRRTSYVESAACFT